jgi:hypothetical protein
MASCNPGLLHHELTLKPQFGEEHDNEEGDDFLFGLSY